MRVANYIMAVLFAVSVALQYNDPDPARWMVMYGAASLACLQMYRWRSDWVFPALVGAAALGWAAYMAPETAHQAGIRDLFQSMDTKGGAELARELGGLIIVIGWMTTLVVHSKRRGRRGAVDG
jgi:hypothetical protein